MITYLRVKNDDFIYVIIRVLLYKVFRSRKTIDFSFYPQTKQSRERKKEV